MVVTGEVRSWQLALVSANLEPNIFELTKHDDVIAFDTTERHWICRWEIAAALICSFSSSTPLCVPANCWCHAKSDLQWQLEPHTHTHRDNHRHLPDTNHSATIQALAHTTTNPSQATRRHDHTADTETTSTRSGSMDGRWLEHVVAHRLHRSNMCECAQCIA